MTSGQRDPGGDIARRATTARTVADLAGLLRELRRREGRDRQGPLLTYRQIADRTGWSVASVGAYLTGVALAPTDRFDELLLVLGVRPDEHRPLATARDRVDDVRRSPRVVAGVVPPSAEDPTAPARMLPAAARDFTGRVGALSELDGFLASPGSAGAVVVTAVAGMPGVGKTTLAVHWGQAAARHFPDGQLYVNLRGYDPGEPLSTNQALAVLLGGLGLPPSAIPLDEAGRSALYQTVLSGRRILLLLDNAGSAAQVRPLLPLPPGLALVTSRDDLEELVTRDGARRVRLDVFAPDEAVALLGRLIGTRVDREPQAARALAARCGLLPLALRVVAELAVFRANVPLAALVEELDADSRAGGLDAFDSTGDARTDIRAVLSWSVRYLPAPAARAFHLLGLHPGADIDEFGLAALAGVVPAEAADLLATLRRAHLIDAWPTGRHTRHDLVRAYASESVLTELDELERARATTRLLDYFLAGAIAAGDTQYPHYRLVRDRIRRVPVGGIAIPDVTDHDVASAWLAAERANLVAACTQAASHRPEYAVAFALALWPFLDDGREDDALAVHTAALAAADELGDACAPADRAAVLGCLATSAFALGRPDDAAQYAQRALAEHTRAGNIGGTALSLAVLGAVREGQGRLREAVQWHERGLAAAVEAGVRPSEAFQLFNLGETYLRLEEYETAVRYYERSAAIEAELELDLAVVESRHGVAKAYAYLGRSQEALAITREALAIEEQHGRLVERVQMMDTLALAHRGLGELAEAIEQLAEAVQLCREIASPRPAAQVLNTFGETYRECGEHALARASHEEALELAERASDRWQRTRALVGLGDAHAGLGDTDRAHELWWEALAHYTEMGLPSAVAVQTRLRINRPE